MKEGNQPFNAQKALRVACLVLADLILINLSAFLALYIRFEFDLKLLCETEFLHNMIVYSGINSVCTILIFYILKLYNSLWEFAGVSELVRTAVGCFFSAVFYMVGMFMLHLTVPRSFPAIYMLVLCLLCGALRFAYRCARRTRVGLHSRGGRRTMLIGGGQAGAIVLREFQTSPRSENKVVCIIDDSPDKVGSYLRGVKIVGSVRDRERVMQVFDRYRPDLVCHAAAHKHVPLMETSPFEAIKNNVFGTYNVAQAADRFGTQRFILISTDKAVNPTNVMGASKRLCEMIVQMINDRSATEYVAVRFGNVLGSAGSVIPLFRKQIRSGGPVTVTDKRVIRYFMTIPEAVQLIFQAGAYARGGEIFVLDMGEPVCIDDLARNMIRLSGFEPDVDIPIEYTGLRPGEKLYEELLLSGEGMQKTKNDLIYIGHEIAFDPAAFEEDLMLLRAIPETDEPALRAKLRELVPTFHAPDGQTLPQEATVG